MPIDTNTTEVFTVAPTTLPGKSSYYVENVDNQNSVRAFLNRESAQRHMDTLNQGRQIYDCSSLQELAHDVHLQTQDVQSILCESEVHSLKDLLP